MSQDNKQAHLRPSGLEDRWACKGRSALTLPKLWVQRPGMQALYRPFCFNPNVLIVKCLIHDTPCNYLHLMGINASARNPFL